MCIRQSQFPGQRLRLEPQQQAPDLLKRKPDIRRAQAQLVATTVRVGQAKADYFPTFSLTGSTGREATQLHALTLGMANVFSIGPSISVPIFTAGKIRSNVAAQTARMKQAQATYESTALTALEETDNALVNYGNERARRDRLEEVVRASQTAQELAEMQYKAGLVDFLTVLDSERTLASNQDQLAESQVALAANLISLYQALGGGWQVLPWEVSEARSEGAITLTGRAGTSVNRGAGRGKGKLEYTKESMMVTRQESLKELAQTARRVLEPVPEDQLERKAHGT